VPSSTLRESYPSVPGSRPERGNGQVQTARCDLEAGCKQLQGYPYQTVLRELQTMSRHSERPQSGRAAVEMAARYARERTYIASAASSR
jgi:hypothetical protein